MTEEIDRTGADVQVGSGKGKPRFSVSSPAAGWGAAKSVTGFMLREGELIDGSRAILKMNHAEHGFDCPGCAWPDDIHGVKLDICENGVKHVTWR